MSEKTKKVLVCDDSLLIRMQLKDFISKVDADIEVIEATNGQEAYQLFEENQPALVFLDIVMPELNGIECLRKIKSNFEDAKVVILSSVGNKDMLKDALKAGAENFLQKPWEEDSMKKIIETYL
ncbi:response regulator [Serpentinicella sp. ANB-PHB4]|uniref:response regulator transcription factor n=1 Tax=Serpentinicella sp. ANB-PHB4 TaxID=3074076 RepID=UPI00285490CA|nr:response regulator [Serpentinicella sp. ANB-PHB4]MDR5659761.1 response regulator [Serpentinicella sp. ANB-PHB4]